MPPQGRYRSSSPDDVIALGMLHHMHDPPTEQETYLSSKVWTEANTPRQPADPLDLGGRVHAINEANPVVQNLHNLNRSWLATVQESKKPGAAPISKEAYMGFKAEHERAEAMYISDQRRIQTEPAGSSVTLLPQIGTVELFREIRRDIGDGWRFPGGLNPKQNPRSLHSTFQLQMYGFKRDLFDNGHAYAAVYPPGMHVAERVGLEGEVLADLGGHRFLEARGRDRRYVMRGEVDWEDVAANGGLGDLVIIEDEVRKQGMKRAEGRRPWDAVWL
jgi:hypothetical protein